MIRANNVIILTTEEILNLCAAGEITITRAAAGAKNTGKKWKVGRELEIHEGFKVIRNTTSGETAFTYLADGKFIKDGPLRGHFQYSDGCYGAVVMESWMSRGKVIIDKVALVWKTHNNKTAYFWEIKCIMSTPKQKQDSLQVKS